jgi:hypothetical protein
MKDDTLGYEHYFNRILSSVTVFNICRRDTVVVSTKLYIFFIFNVFMKNMFCPIYISLDTHIFN